MFERELRNSIEGRRILIMEPLSKHTTFRIGGPADYFIITQSEEELRVVLELCDKYKLPVFMLGNGSNLLVDDAGYRGVVIKQEEYNAKFIASEYEDGYLVTVGAGMNLSAFAMKVADMGLTGFEFAAGIPGTLGGAVYMNAGAYDGQIKDCITSVKVVTTERKVLERGKEELELGYRSSAMQHNGDYVIEATFFFRKGSKDEILTRIVNLNNLRKQKQPLEYPSAGSTFKRPEGYFAAKLIMDAGLRGYRVGGAMISEKHCGFVINTGNATAKDVKELIADVIRIVYEKFGVTLEPEIRII